MRGRFGWRLVLVAALMAGALAACGDDDDGGDATPDTTEAGAGGAAGDNTLGIEMIDYAYKIDGEVRSGLVTIESTNTGEEWHMAGFARLKAGKTLEELVTALQSAGGPPGGESTETTAEGATLRAAGQETTTTTAAGGEGEGGGEEGDPFAEFVEEELGAPGHVLQPGQDQALTVDLDPGNYVMLCFLPTEGEGTPHFAKGMVGGFEVADEAADVEAPEADATIILGDETEPTGVPTDLEAGEHTFKLTSEGESGKDFIVGQLDEGKEFSAFDEYFEGEGGFESESGPPKGYAKQAPGTILASTFEVEPGRSIWVTVDIPKGETYFIGTTNVDGDEGEDAVDKFVKVDVS